MQEKVLKSILLFLKYRQIPSEKNLVHSVVHKVEGYDPGSIIPSVIRIVKLLSGVPCFEVNIQQ